MQDTIQTKITYLERNIKVGFSIHKVFHPLYVFNKSRATMSEAPSHLANFKGLADNFKWAWSWRKSDGIIHITGDVHYLVMAMIGRPCVLTVHDIVTSKLPGNFIKKFLIKLLWFWLPLKLVNHITCISENTRNDLIKHFNVPAEKITVVHNPYDTMFKYSPKAFNAACPTILHIGTGWNKNLERVIEALNGLSCKLVIIGRVSQEQKRLLEGSGVAYEIKYNLSDDEMFNEYVNCDIVSFPSLYEGFGMPIIEGQVTGRIVLTSDRAPMTEIAGNAAVLVDPENVESIKNGFLKIITDEKLRDTILSASAVNVEKYDVKHIAAQYDKVYEKVLHNR